MTEAYFLKNGTILVGDDGEQPPSWQHPIILCKGESFSSFFNQQLSLLISVLLLLLVTTAEKFGNNEASDGWFEQP